MSEVLNIPHSYNQETKQWEADGSGYIANSDGSNKVTPNEVKEIQRGFSSHLAETAKKTTANITYYVNASTGSNSNDGLTSGSAFQTIQYAIDLLPQIINHTVNIEVAPGTYAETVSILGFVGKGTLTITAPSPASGNLVNNVVVINCSIPIDLTRLRATSTTSIGFFAEQCINIRINLCEIITASSFDGTRINKSLGQLVSCVISNRGSAINAMGQSTVYSNGNTGSGNRAGLDASSSATIGKHGTQPTGTAAEIVTQGGVIR